MQSPCHAAESILSGESYKKRGEPLTCLGIVGPKCHKTAQGSAETSSKHLVYKEFQKQCLDIFVCNCERTKTDGDGFNASFQCSRGRILDETVQVVVWPDSGQFFRVL